MTGPECHYFKLSRLFRITVRRDPGGVPYQHVAAALRRQQET
jgi:hypothetical protein